MLRPPRTRESVSKAGRANKGRIMLVAGVIVAAGVVTAVAASATSGPFASLRVYAKSHLVESKIPSTAINASALYPPPAPPATINKVVNVYDIPPRTSAPAPVAKSRENAPVADSRGNPAGGQQQWTGPFPIINFPAGPMSAIEATCEAAKKVAERYGGAYQQNVERQCEAAKQAYEHSHP